jgi:rubrerythrin
MGTRENLQNAFAGESQANRKYLAFAKKAEADGYPQVAKLFRAAAEAETVHAHAHLRAMGGIKDTADNLQAAISGEGFEFQEMYPPYVAKAEEEGDRRAAMSFENALAVEEVHHDLYSEALAAVKEGKDLLDKPIFVCDVCGMTLYGEPPEKCPVCGARRSRFFEVT